MGFRGCALRSSDTFVNVLKVAVGFVLTDLDDLRLKDSQPHCGIEEALLEVEDAYMCLDYQDLEGFATAQKKARAHSDSARDFANEFRSERKLVRQRKEAAEGGGAGKGKGKGKDKKPEERYKIPSTIPHSEAKKHIPPDTSIWRGVVRPQWCCHVKPFKRHSVPWLTYGEDVALKIMLRDMWKMYLFREGL